MNDTKTSLKGDMNSQSQNEMRLYEKFTSEQQEHRDSFVTPDINNCVKTSSTETSTGNMCLNSFCEKWHDGSRRLIIRGKDFVQRMGRHFQDCDIPYLVVFLRSNRDVTSLDLAYNNIRCVGFANLIDYVTTYRHIVELNVQNNSISEPGIQHLCQVGENMPLKMLRLNGNKFGVEAAKKLALFLLQNSHLTRLDVAEVDQTISSLVFFTSVMRLDQAKCNETLKILDLSRPNPCGMYKFDSTHMASVIGCMLRFNRSLVALHLQKYNFSCHDIEAMVQDMKYNNTLRLLDLCCNNIGDHGLDYLSSWLKERPALKGLLLGHNIVTNYGARALSFCMPTSRLVMLDLSYNRITDSGATDILNTIKKTPSLRHLKFAGNTLGYSTAEIVQRMLISGVLVQQNIDIQPYRVEQRWHVANYSADCYDKPYHSYFQLLGIPFAGNEFVRKTMPKMPFRCHDLDAIKPERYEMLKIHSSDCTCCKLNGCEVMNSPASSVPKNIFKDCECAVGKYEDSREIPSIFYSGSTLHSDPPCNYLSDDPVSSYCMQFKDGNEVPLLSQPDVHPNNCNCCKCNIIHTSDISKPCFWVNRVDESIESRHGSDQSRKIAPMNELNINALCCISSSPCPVEEEKIVRKLCLCESADICESELKDIGNLEVRDTREENKNDSKDFRDKNTVDFEDTLESTNGKSHDALSEAESH